MAGTATAFPCTFRGTVQKGELVKLQAQQPRYVQRCGTFEVPGCVAAFEMWARISASGDELFASLECVDAAEGFKRVPGMTQVKATFSVSVEATQGATTVMAPREMRGPKHEHVFDGARQYCLKLTCEVSAADGTVLGDDATFKLAVTVTSLSHDLVDIERFTVRLQLNSKAGEMATSIYGKAEYSDMDIVVPAVKGQCHSGVSGRFSDCCWLMRRKRAAEAAAHGKQEKEDEEEEEEEEEPELRVPCHRIVLATVSEPLDKMLSSSSHFKEGSQREVTLQEVQPSVAEAFLQWCYGLPVEVSLAQALRVWLCADQYMVAALSDSCSKALLEAVGNHETPSALLQLYHLAQEAAPDSAPAQALWQQLLAKPSHVCAVLPTAYVVSLPVDQVKAAVSAANASYRCDRVHMADAVWAWAICGDASAGTGIRQAHLPELLRCVTLAGLPVVTLKWMADRCSAAHEDFDSLKDRAVAAEVLGDIVSVLAARCCTKGP